jgi:hypothetical protein
MNWREIFGKPSLKQKDQELILRFLAFYLEGERYEKPVNEFLNLFVSRHRYPKKDFVDKCKTAFRNTIDVARKAIVERAFRPEGSINAAVFDSVMVGIAKRLEKGPIVRNDKLLTAYESLLNNPVYKKAIASATSDEPNVRTRLAKAIGAFQNIE